MLIIWRHLLRRGTCTADRNECVTTHDGLQHAHVCGTERMPTKICGLKLHQKLKCSIPSAGEEPQRLSAAMLESHHSISILSWHQREYPEAISASHHKHHMARLWSSLRPKPCQYKSCKIHSGVCRLILFSVSDGSISSLCCEESIWESYIPGFTAQLKTKDTLEFANLD